MGWDFKKELGRKAIHLLSVFIIFIYVIFFETFNEKIALFVLAVMLVIAIELEYIRIEWRTKIPLLNKVYKFRRAKEKNILGAEVFFLLGAIISLAVFDLRIAVASILMTTFGDFTAAIVGNRFRKYPTKIFKGKAWEGVLAELIVNLIVGVLILSSQSYLAIIWIRDFGFSFSFPMWPIVVVMAVTATVVETAVRKIDDNLLIPIFSGLNGQIVIMIMRGLF